MSHESIATLNVGCGLVGIGVSQQHRERSFHVAVGSFQHAEPATRSSSHMELPASALKSLHQNLDSLRCYSKRRGLAMCGSAIKEVRQCEAGQDEQYTDDDPHDGGWRRGF